MIAFFGNARLRAARLAAGLTQNELGHLAGADELTICKLETGRIRNPPA